MFNRTDLELLKESKLTDWRFVGCYPGLHYTVYPQYAFCESASEETIQITRAPKQQGDSGLRFWLSAEWAQGWSGREHCMPAYVRGAAFESISESEFNQLIAEQAKSLLVPLPLPLHSPQGFVGALILYSLKMELTVSLFAEYEDEFIHFYWDTTA